MGWHLASIARPSLQVKVKSGGGNRSLDVGQNGRRPQRSIRQKSAGYLPLSLVMSPTAAFLSDKNEVLPENGISSFGKADAQGMAKHRFELVTSHCQRRLSLSTERPSRLLTICDYFLILGDVLPTAVAIDM